MSASPMARQAASSHQGIPTRRVVINHESEMPTDYGTTPGGTMFGTTPGGTRIVYERAFLLSMRQSPLARTPPANLPVIPGITAPKNNDNSNNKANGRGSPDNKKNNKNHDSKKERQSSTSSDKRTHDSIKEEDGEQFSMDM